MIRADGGLRRSRSGCEAASTKGSAVVGGARDVAAARAILPVPVSAHVRDQHRAVQPTHSPLDLLWTVRGRGAERVDGGRHGHGTQQTRPGKMMRASGPRRRIGIASLAAVMAMAASCGFGPSTFALNNATVDSSYQCPTGANNSAYDLHATIQVTNGTSNTVTIESVAVVMTLVAVKGSWLEKLGDKYTASNVT